MPCNAGPHGEAPGSGRRHKWQEDVARAFTVVFSGKERQGTRFMIGKFE